MGDNQVQKNNSFVREKIKEKPFNKKRALIRLLVSALSGIIFAGMACLVFALLLPRLQLYTNGISASETTVGASESTFAGSETVEDTGSLQEDTGVSGESSEMSGGETQNMIEDTQTPSTEQEQVPDQGEPCDTETSQTMEQNYSLTLADYQSLQDELYSIGANVNASIVTITSVVSDTDLFNNAYEAEDQGSGVIISENDKEYLILTERKVIKDAARISVTFLDDSVCDATLKKEDKGTGLAVLSVDKAIVAGSKTVATIGNSLSVRGGMIAIALGSPLGTNYSILTGNITSTNNEISIEDHNYTVFTTDIVANKDGSGVLINVEGEIVGIVMQDYSASRAENTLTAVSASELLPVIEKLCAGEDIPYMGIKVSTVTSKIENAYGIPKGVYIKEVTMDSPAMNAGLQSGDVITSINGQKVSTDVAFANALLALSPEETATVEVKRKGASEYVTNTYDVTIGVLQ